MLWVSRKLILHHLFSYFFHLFGNYLLLFLLIIIVKKDWSFLQSFKYHILLYQIEWRRRNVKKDGNLLDKEQRKKKLVVCGSFFLSIILHKFFIFINLSNSQSIVALFRCHAFSFQYVCFERSRGGVVGNMLDCDIIFLSLRVFRLLSSSLLLFPQRFGRYVLRPSSGVCRTQEPTPITVTLCSLSFFGDNHLEVAGSILTAGE